MARLSENERDVIAEVEAFTPDEFYRSCRANSAGTKVIYTRHDGRELTVWARPRKDAA